MTRRGAKLGTALLLLLGGCQPPATQAQQGIMPAPASLPPADSAAAGDDGAAGRLACRNDIEAMTVVTESGLGMLGHGVPAAGLPGDGTLQTADRGIGGTGVTGGITGGIGGTGISGGIGGTGITGGIGGTGIIGGIGGTGLDGSVDVTRIRGRAVVDRGLGGTGVVGTITGFASVCLNGVEVGLAGTAMVNVDGVPLPSATLRLGEVAIIDANSKHDGLHAVSITIRHEVSGPVDSVDHTPAGLRLQVAGQQVMLAQGARVPDGLAAGDWVAISGLRDPDRTIRASRIDRRVPGRVFLSGRPVLKDGVWHIGALPLRVVGPAPRAGERQVIAGSLLDGVLLVDVMQPDHVVPANPKDRHFIVEGYASVSGATLRTAQGLQASLGPNFGAAPPGDRPVVLELNADATDNLVAVSWRPLGVPGPKAGG